MLEWLLIAVFMFMLSCAICLSPFGVPIAYERSHIFEHRVIAVTGHDPYMDG